MIRLHLRFIGLFSFCLISYNCFSQQQPEYPSPNLNFNPTKLNSEILSPQVASFQEYKMLPVNLYTGKVDVTIPIYEIQSGGISVPISISYNTGGIKVDQESSSVGLGWVLNAGGSIYRKINDIPDNQIDIGTFVEYDWDVVPAAYPILQSVGFNRKYDFKKGKKDWTYFEYGSGNYYCDAMISERLEGEGSAPADFNNGVGYGGEDGGYNSASTAGNNIDSVHSDLAPDVFIANAPGLSTNFTALRDTNTFLSGSYGFNNATFKGETLDHSGVLVNNMLLDIRTQLGFGFFESILDPSQMSDALEFRKRSNRIRDFYEFNLTNTNGLEYTFDKEDYTESFTYSDNYFDNNNIYDRIKIGYNYYNKSINAWNLSKIKNPDTYSEINFIYDEYSKSTPKLNRYVESNYEVSAFQGDFMYDNTNGCTCLTNPNYFIDGQSQPHEGPINNVSKHPKLHRLNRIVFDEGVVEFIYGYARIDDLEERALTQIIVKDYNNVIIKKIRLDYTYFQSKENCSQAECYRLRLDAIHYFSPDDTLLNSHSFEYNYENKLPKRGSVQQDYLGYYNNNGVSGVGNSYTKPKLYYYKNSGSNSILPFPLSNKPVDITINGPLNMEPNSYSKSGSLKRINYPTGGYSEFEYENHTFYFDGAEYLAGGLRIKKQIISNSEGSVREFVYQYKKDNGTSSGTINNIPVFAYPKYFTLSPFNIQEFTVYDMNKANLALTNNSFVGYSQVKQQEIGNGSIAYKFTSPSDFPAQFNTRTALNGLYNPGTYGPDGNPGNYSYNCVNKFMQNSAFSLDYFKDIDFKRGKLKSKIIKNENSQNQLKEIYEYSTNQFGTINLISKLRFTPTKKTTGMYTFSHAILNNSQFVYARDLTTKKTTTEYLVGGNKVTSEFYYYDNDLPLLNRHKIEDNVSTIETRTYYPFDSEVSSLSFMNELVSANKLYEPIKSEVFKDYLLLSTNLINYDNFNSSFNAHYMPKSLSASKADSPLIEEGSMVDRRDNKGNIEQYTREDGVSVTTIWGYKSNHPIAILEGVEYTEAHGWLYFDTGYTFYDITTLSNSDIDSTTEQELRDLLDVLRLNISQHTSGKAFITTYTYNPLIGMTSFTDPRGKTTYYEYDEFNRLKHIKDHDGNILEKTEYNYKNEY
ncbi:RHS repeat domain-containing protein [Xanthomarina spongicola]|uniref:YD repeat-containing protein n=1 Tax=Xanthomarina spongicola TaxID=570520 RepID=A0A316DPM8_9FLAO|nr:RHS repeat domain-containing protein [Xanthomarina spongicola]PWK20031.1 YD repeat-containing protein [Xanthomarina spongicola]